MDEIAEKGIEERVIGKIRLRRIRGQNKYGRSMEREDLTTRQWLVHAQEEAMDLAIYLERLIREEDINALARAANKIESPEYKND